MDLRLRNNKRLLLAVCLTALAVALGGLAQTMQRGPTRSPHGPLKIRCANCHSTISFTPLRSVPEFNHKTETRYPLRGMHERVECRQCHTKLVFRDTATACANCHVDIHRRQFGGNCEQCHNVGGWKLAVQSTREHSARFPLIGGHAAVDCESCHRGAGAAKFAGLSTSCLSCHQMNYLSAQSVDHRAAGFPLTCNTCHVVDSWMRVNFDHGRFTGFALTGTHGRLDCASCHLGGRYKGTTADCYSCHSKDFAATTNPNHVAAGFPTSCSVCHRVDTWAGAQFDHARTKFQLVGSHLKLQCAQCHVNNRFSGTPANCAGCHMDAYNKTSNPNHVTAGFPTNCAVCHRADTWAGAQFDHGLTKFALTGAHGSVQCAQCHVNNQYAGTPLQCAGCHLDAFKKTTNPNHVTAGLPQDCALCHSTARWQGAVFDHARTKFALTGAHTRVDCAQCHTNGQFSGLSMGCVSCHLTKYNATTNPKHSSAGFPQQCEVCHSTNAWTPASFNHATTKFPLTGAHTTVQCASCHIGGVYAGTPSDCYSCHKVQYQGTTNPNHVAAKYPTTCAACHTTSRWSGATAAHTRFPISTGKHARVWTSCGDCHTNASNYQVFSCTNCHTHSQSATDGHHRGVRNYVYTPTSCYSCHPTGGGG